MTAFLWLHLHFLYSSPDHQNRKPANYITQTPLPTGSQLGSCKGWSLDGGRGATLFSCFWSPAAAAANSCELLASGSCRLQHVWTLMSVDPWTPAQGRLPDLWVTTSSPACSSTHPAVLLLQLGLANTSVTNLSHFNPSLLEST